MTNEQIIKALECCSIEGDCKTCPFYNVSETDCGECIRLLQILSHNLILRQQETINHFVKVNKMVVEPKTSETEDEILKRLLTKRVEFIPSSQDVEDTKMEAVREFVEKLKTKLTTLEYKTNTHRKTCSVDYVDKTVNWTLHDVMSTVIDSLVNEMFGNPEEVKCKDCKHLMYSDCYGECSQGYKGIVQPDDSCKYGERKLK